jgi:uncharacterized protein (DUF433 family)
MALQLDDWQLPLRVDSEGDLRVGKSRVLLDTVIYAYRQHDTPERIVEQFPTLELPDVYAAIAFYLRYSEAVDVYIADREKAGAELRREIAVGSESGTFRDQLLARIGKSA